MLSQGVGLHIALYTRGWGCTLLYTQGWDSIVHTCTSLRSEVVEEGAEVALSSSDVDKAIRSCHAGALPAIFFTHGVIRAVTG